MAADTIPAGLKPPALCPPPWKTKATMYIIPFWTSSQTASNLPAKAYHPLEYHSSFSSREFGIPKGGVSLIQLIRYHETPVGPYDELILCPGSFEYPFETADGKKTTKRALRITRIYVSQKHTCWNGRKLWNLPKHLARFTWETPSPSGPTTIKVYPHDSHTPYNPAESHPSTAPFFQCTFHPIPLLPSFPLSTTWLSKFGFDYSLVQPPLPEGKEASQGELPGTEAWVAARGFRQGSRRGGLVWGNFEQEDGGEFWPGLGKRGLVVVLDKGEAEFEGGESWETPGWLV